MPTINQKKWDRWFARLPCPSEGFGISPQAECTFGVDNFFDKANQHNSGMGEPAFGGRTDKYALRTQRSRLAQNSTLAAAGA